MNHFLFLAGLEMYRIVEKKQDNEKTKDQLLPSAETQSPHRLLSIQI